MADVVPEGMFGENLSSMESLVAASARFQTWTGSANATEAAEHVYLIWVPGDDLTGNLPWSSVDIGVVNANAIDAAPTFRDTLGLMVDFRAEATYLDSPRNSALDFMNDVGVILQELKDGLGDLPELRVSGIELEFGPGRSSVVEDRDTGTPFWHVGFRFDLGGG